MSDNNGFIWGAAVIALMSYVELARETRSSPCVYSHTWMTDLVSGNDQKRTCPALLKESNSRIEAQQTQINALTEQIDALHAEPDPAAQTTSAPVAGQASGQEAPTLSAEVGTEVAHADEDQDD